jgi:predicted TPR repeat methyltransferase
VFAPYRKNDPELTRIEELIEKNELANAATSLNALRERSPQDPRIYSIGARLALVANNPEAALKSSDIALQLAPGWPRAYAQRARALGRLERFSECLDACARAVEGDPRLLGPVELAVDAGRRLGNLEVPEALLRKVQAVDPENRRIWLGLGRFLHRYKDEEAATWLERVLAVEPDNVDAMLTLSVLRFEAGNREAALPLIERAYAARPEDETIRFQHARISGAQDAQVPSSMVEDLFDGYAERFDQQLVSQLGYRLPRIVAERIKQRYANKNFNVLDLGCGTGLFGRVLGKVEGYFIGVDLSQKMLEKAAEVGVYDRLHHVDVVEALNATEANEYEVIVANDVLVYIADIEPFVKGTYKVLRPNGVAYFSCELATAEEPPVILRATQRYAHRVDSVRAMCERAGFSSIDIEEFVVRTDHGAPIQSFLVTVTKASTT